MFLFDDRSLDSVLRVKPVRCRDPLSLATADAVSKEHSDVAVASNVSLADRFVTLVMLSLVMIILQFTFDDDRFVKL